jgi:predicted NUDIX family NTP pyrophosphohydrolase
MDKMPKLSAGIIVYKRVQADALHVLLVHPGGPFYAKKDVGVWSIPKGEYIEGEDALTAAKREFEEETGNVLPDDGFIPLQPIKIKSGKIISAWAVEADFDNCFIWSNLFEIEWPPKSGKMQSFAEADKAEWFTIDEARIKISPGQLALLEQLVLLA